MTENSEKYKNIKTEKTENTETNEAKDTEREISFEKAMSRLEKIVSSLEKGDAELDLSLKLFEEGISLVRYCTDKLEKAEQKVKVLTLGDTPKGSGDDFGAM